MESDHYVCLDTQVGIIINIVSKANSKFYSNVPTVMLAASNEILTKETGLNYIGHDEDEYWFDIMDKTKFFLTKIKYGI